MAVPTYLWARSIASMRWALAAAGLVLLAPALHYAGFLMTEPLTLTVVTIALLAMARALQRPSMWRYGVFAAWATAAAAVRLQALVLLPAFLAAALLDALAARDGKRLRPLLLLGGVAVGVTVAVALLVVVFGGELSTRAGARRLHADRRGRTGGVGRRCDRLACVRRRAPRLRRGGARDGRAGRVRRSRVATRTRRCARSLP